MRTVFSSWWFWTVAGSLALVVFDGAALQFLYSSTDGADADAEYYAAVAAVIPLLFLTLVAALGRTRPRFSDRRTRPRFSERRLRELRDRAKRLSHEIDRLEAQATEAGADDVLQRTREMRDELGAEEVEATFEERKRGRRWLRAVWIGGLVTAGGWAAVAEAADLAALAFDTRTEFTFDLTVGAMFYLFQTILLWEIIDTANFFETD
jgi:hypothetical protein